MAEKRRRLGKGLDALLSPTHLGDIENETTASATIEAPVEAAATAPGDGKGVPLSAGATNTYVTSGPAATISEPAAPNPAIGSAPPSHLDATAGHRGEHVRHLPVRLIWANRHQPRLHWNEETLQELAESIRANGIIQPILVRPAGEGYELIAGERRWRAAKMAGLDTVPAIVRTATEEESVEWALVENIHRTDLSPIERAHAYAKYLKAFSLTQEEGARRLGENRATVANYMRLLELDETIQQMVNAGELSMGHARALLGLRNELERRTLAKLIAARGLSVRETERYIQRRRETAPADPGPRPQRPPHIRELEEELTRAVGTRVAIHTTGRKGHRGRILIDFYSLEDFERIREQLHR